MKLSWLLVVIALLCCAIAALAQETSPGEKPPAGHDSGHAGEKGEQDSSSYDGVMCIALALQCPDGTFATQNKQCQYICGKAPIGGLSYDDVAIVMGDFIGHYTSQIKSFRISNLNRYQVAIQTPPESRADYCIEATISTPNHIGLPDVYNGVRVMYVQAASPPVCSPMLCPDGTVVGCNDVCPEVQESESMPFFTPLTIILGVFLLSACCCCLRQRRKCRAKCQVPTPLAPQVLSTNAAHEDMYPAEQYLLQQEHAEPEVPMHPIMMAQPMYPPMPMIPPHMMMMPNGSYPIMMQAPNGMWYPVAPHPEDV
eukprot:Phypoly_transcript_13115.p1 GENE.Phypoly_transcript_13115~~Phypoly_transcript_13115.p1  ORF type:complete len:312 (+),score=49.91 Phypoly_transcript_13115:59-994(+)